MKTSLKNKVLILSLAALVVAGTGCERRGRAVKKDAPKEGFVETDSQKTVACKKTKEGTTEKTQSSTPIEVSNEETRVLADAKIDCPLNIDVAETSSIETFQTDLASMKKLMNCLVNYGVNLKQEENADKTEKNWSIDPAALSKEFDTLAKAIGSDDDQAKRVMKSRVEVLKLNSKKMLDKYTETRLKSATEYELYQSTYTVGGTLVNFAKTVTTCEEAAELVDGYYTVKDGTDRTISEDNAAE